MLLCISSAQYTFCFEYSYALSYSNSNNATTEKLNYYLLKYYKLPMINQDGQLADIFFYISILLISSLLFLSYITLLTYALLLISIQLIQILRMPNIFFYNAKQIFLKKNYTPLIACLLLPYNYLLYHCRKLMVIAAAIVMYLGMYQEPKSQFACALRTYRPYQNVNGFHNPCTKYHSCVK